MEYMRESNMDLSAGRDIDFLKTAMADKRVLCHKALVYERGLGLHFNLGGIKAIMPVEEVIYSPVKADIKEAAVATRVNKNVCFVVTDIHEDNYNTTVYISRAKAQQLMYENYISALTPGDIIQCVVTHVDSFGVFCDIGYGVNALLPIDFISVSRINKPADRFREGQTIYTCIKSIDENGRIVLTHKELLGTWLENSKMFKAQSTTIGVVRSIEDYGIFIELTPNLAGLAEVSEGIAVGDVVTVFIKSILPDKMKIKLVVMNTLRNYEMPADILYFTTEGHIDRWQYSTENSKKNIYTEF